MSMVKTPKKKLHIVFDVAKRREFLTGFRKRKLQRKQAAKDELEKELKNERKRLKLEAKESYKKLVKSYASIPEIEELQEVEYEDDEVNVKVVELSTCDTAKQIGPNQPQYEEDEPEIKTEVKDELDEVPGMEMHGKAVIKKEKKDTVESEPKTMGDIKKLVKKQATRNVKKSKVFQQKHKMERQQQRIKSIKKKAKDKKIQEKQNNKKGKRKLPKKSMHSKKH